MLKLMDLMAIMMDFDTKYGASDAAQLQQNGVNGVRTLAIPPHRNLIPSSVFERLLYFLYSK